MIKYTIEPGARIIDVYRALHEARERKKNGEKVEKWIARRGSWEIIISFEASNNLSDSSEAQIGKVNSL